MDSESTGQVEPIFVTVADAALILGLAADEVEQLIRAGYVKAVEQFARQSVVLASLYDYAKRLQVSA